MKNKSFIIIFIVFIPFLIAVPQTETEQTLRNLPMVISVEKIETEPGYAESFKILFEQPVDHNFPEDKKFKQKLYISHKDYSLPVVIELDGYNIDTNRPNELASILKCNKIIVEHRYFGESIPAETDWNTLTIEQAANDHHKIIETFKQIYNSRFITTGISKGGQSTYIHKYYFPDDADVSICYVAPLNLAPEDPRIYHFLDNVGNEECREKMKLFQWEVLKREDVLIPLFKKDADENGYTFSLGSDRFIFEFIVLEYGFAFWQWQYTNCSQIPDTTASDEDLWNHLKKGSSYTYFSDQEAIPNIPFAYQAYSQMGYYGYDISELKDLLREVEEPTSKIFLPDYLQPEFDCCIMQKINSWIQKHGNNMIFIYGEIDSWTATAVELTGETNAIRMVKKGGTHRTRIKSFEGQELEKIYSTLEDWLNINIERD